MQSPIQTYLESIHKRLAADTRGDVASYIPELTKANPAWFGISVVTLDGTRYSAGDTQQLFTLQSTSKPFVYGTALTDRGIAYVRSKIGVEPSGDAFNSISLDPKTGAPKNPMINAGAIAATSLVGGTTAAEQWANIRAALGRYAGRDLDIDEAVYSSESTTGHRNRAIAWMLKNFGIIEGEPMDALENYFRQCSFLVTCDDLAMMAATLANGGVNPLSGQRALSSEHVERVLSVMTSCGMYDYSGSWIYEVGIPAKSGVGGGIMAVLPGRFGIGVFSPLLDEKGNSVRGIEACKSLSSDLKLHVFTHLGDPRAALGRIYTGADAPSRRQPLPPMKDYLGRFGHRIKYLCLHGYLGVDGVEYIIRRMQAMAQDTQCFILDMHQVDGVCDSAARLITETRLRFEREGIHTVFSRIQGRRGIIDPLSHSLRSDERGFLSFEDNDLAVEWCENQLFSGQDSGAPEDCTELAQCRLFQGADKSLLERVAAIAGQREFPAGSRILSAGQAGDGEIFLLQRGQVSILVPLDHGAHQRVSTLGPGMSFGEMLLLGKSARSATVHADTDVCCWILQAADLNVLCEEFPQLKVTLLHNLAADLASKLRRATQWIGALA